ncbi:CHAP domain-containing protein [Pelagerythrobacter aerophilus]|uniref:CHAP domain-containing protein n=1 Tax=Pelagerythrobacter aerophilus TaxID=2306995 RepID=A0A418NHA7_9SPHN|nr:CHAP domain-containing protein [Pelagerythrobacter aerophilus]RIV77960.1 CHAP domain-containing protein [Pelagerythrobacter aerophilus]
MRANLWILAAAGLCAFHGPALADASPGFDRPGRDELPAYLQCVPYARELSGVEIYGDAHTWWSQAAGRYERGDEPRVGAVMAFVPHGSMRLGHVATVSQVIDSRTVLLDHANWSPINGRRGQIERDVKAIDVSPANDWSQVRVWYDPIQGLGTTVWPVHGFIYGEEARFPETRLAGAVPPSRAAPSPLAPARPLSSTPSRTFLNAFAEMAKPASDTRRNLAAQAPARMPAEKAMPRRREAPAPRDPIAAAVARYGN